MADQKIEIKIGARLDNVERDFTRVNKIATDSAKRIDAAFTGLAPAMKAALGGLAAYIPIAAVTSIVGSLAEAQQAAQRLRNSLDYGTGGKAGKELTYLADVTDRIGLDFSTAAAAYSKFAAATRGSGISLEQTRTVFEGVAQAAARMGLSADETQGALLALSQMASKGTVQAEELRGQLGERLPGAFNIAAKAMGVTTAELGKMLENGQVLASDFLPKFGRALKEQFEAPMSSLTQEINRFNSAWTRWKQEVSDGTSGSSFSALTTGLNESTAAMKRLGDEAGLTHRLLVAIGGFMAGATGNSVFDTTGAQAQARERLAELKKAIGELETQERKYGSLPPITANRLKSLREEAQETRDTLMNLAVRRGKETGLQLPDLRGEFEAQRARQEAAVKAYLADLSNAPKEVKIAAAVEKENKAFETAVAGLQETDARYVEALRAHQARVAEITRDTKPKKSEDILGTFIADRITPQLATYEQAIASFSDMQREASVSSTDLTAAEQKFLDLVNSPEWQTMGEPWRELVRNQFEAANSAQSAAAYQEKLNGLLADTPTAKIEKLTSDFAFLTDARNRGQVSQAQYEEAIYGRLDKNNELIKEQKDLAHDLGLTFTSAFEDAVIGGKKFSEVLQGLSEDIARIVIRKNVTEPLANSVSSFDWSKLFSSFFANADGGVYASPSLSAYSGRVYNTPQFFKFASGAGVFAEAGPEAIMPLARTSDGKLGVRAQGGAGTIVNVINNASGTETTQRRRSGSNGEEIIDIVIDAVKSDLIGDVGRGGSFAGALESQYALNRSAGAWR